MKRIFIALKVEAEGALLKMIESLKSELVNENIKWVNTENIHVTLLFLGDTSEENTEKICRILNSSCNGSGKFELLIKGSGVFKSFNDPRVIWTGIGQSEKLTKLNSIITQGVKKIEPSMEVHPFKPHLTLGRIRNLKDKIALENLLGKYQDSEIQKVPVNEVILYESILKPAGPVYKPIEKFEL